MPSAAKFGLDRPLYVRFADFYWDLARLDFGKSLRHRIDAQEMIFDRLPNTAVLAIVAWAIGMLGIPLGILAARRPRGFFDRLVNVLSFAGYFRAPVLAGADADPGDFRSA